MKLAEGRTNKYSRVVLAVLLNRVIDEFSPPESIQGNSRCVCTVNPVPDLVSQGLAKMLAGR